LEGDEEEDGQSDDDEGDGESYEMVECDRNGVEKEVSIFKNILKLWDLIKGKF